MAVFRRSHAAAQRRRHGRRPHVRESRRGARDRQRRWDDRRLGALAARAVGTNQLAHRQRGSGRQSRRVRYHVETTCDRRMGIRVLVVGGGGREDALSYALARSPSIETVFAAPGNAGTATRGENWDIVATDGKALASRASNERIDLAVLG